MENLALLSTRYGPNRYDENDLLQSGVLLRHLILPGAWQNTAILYVGPAIGAHPPFEREIDLKGNLLMPGFKHAHAHSAMTFLRSYADDLPLPSRLFDKVFPLEDVYKRQVFRHLPEIGKHARRQKVGADKVCRTCLLYTSRCV